jgi:hypothetical protein
LNSINIEKLFSLIMAFLYLDGVSSYGDVDFKIIDKKIITKMGFPGADSYNPAPGKPLCIR